MTAASAAIFMSICVTPQVALTHDLLPTGLAASSGMRCEERAVVVRFLHEKYNESLFSVGVTQTGYLIEVLISPGGGTWTILFSSPQGRSCLLAAGQGWRRLERELILPLGPPVKYGKDRPD